MKKQSISIVKKYNLDNYKKIIVPGVSDYACDDCHFYKGGKICKILTQEQKPGRDTSYREIGCLKHGDNYIFVKSLNKLLEKL